MSSKITTVAVVLLSCLTVLGQKTEFVKSDSLLYPIHKANLGKIAFIGTTIAIENSKETDFLKSVTFTEKTDLNIRVFLTQSLTNQLHLLAPQATAEALTSHGNYQFTFIVDGKKVYTENLNVGAGSAASKNQKTTFSVPLISTANEDSWGRFLWNRFYGNGGQDALTEGTHLLQIEIRPYLKMPELVTGNLLAIGAIEMIVPEIKIDEKQVAMQRIAHTKDWQLATAKLDVAKIEALNRKIAKQTYKNVTSIVAIKDGKLLLEEYFNGANRNTLHDTRSVGKSFASTLMGIAIGDQFIKSETQTLKAFYELPAFQNYSRAKDSITLQSLLTMSSAFDGSDMNSDSPGNEENMYPSENWVNFALNLPVDKTKVTGKQWDYFTAGCIVLGDIIDKAVPQGLEKYADKKLFRPLNITHYQWQYTPQKVANTAGSLQLNSLDYAKFGTLYQNQGVWKGKQILPKAWVAKSLSHQIAIGDDEFYGYLFWNKKYQVNGQAYEVYYASGNGGNRIFIFKDQPLVIVITATAYNTPYGEKQVDKMMQEYLIPAIMN